MSPLRKIHPLYEKVVYILVQLVLIRLSYFRRYIFAKDVIYDKHELKKYIKDKTLEDTDYGYWEFFHGQVNIGGVEFVAGPINSKSIPQKRIASSEEFFAHIPGGRVYYKHFSIITKDGFLIQPVSNYYGQKRKSHILFRKMRSKKSAFLPGKTLLLRGRNNYFHMLIDVIPTIKIAEDAGLSIHDFDHFLIESYDQNFHSLLARFDIPKEKIVTTTPSSDFDCEHLFFASYHERQGNWYKDFILQRFDLNGTYKTPYGNKIYVSRSRASKRRILNEDHLLEVLQSYGFRKMYNEDHTIDEQAKIYHSADFIISAHGANLANVLFCKPDTKVCEIRYLKHLNFYNKVYFEMCQNFNLKYYLLFCKGNTQHFDSDTEVNISDLENVLRAMNINTPS